MPATYALSDMVAALAARCTQQQGLSDTIAALASLCASTQVRARLEALAMKGHFVRRRAAGGCEVVEPRTATEGWALDAIV